MALDTRGEAVEDGRQFAPRVHRAKSKSLMIPCLKLDVSDGIGEYDGVCAKTVKAENSQSV